MQSPQSYKIVLIGDKQVGKTFLIRSFIDTNLNPTSPTTFDNYSINLRIDDKEYHLSIWDTAGQEQYDQLRVLSYPQTDIFCICYAINNMESFNHIKKWIKEVQRYEGTYVLVGCKADTRNDKVQAGDVVTKESAEKFAKENNMSFIECSALEKENVNLVFKTCVESVNEVKPRKISMWRRIFCCGR
ncbi:hypothetical protein BDAP_002805 [Binucleata daphniae]